MAAGFLGTEKIPDVNLIRAEIETTGCLARSRTFALNVTGSSKRCQVITRVRYWEVGDGEPTATVV
jgi:hypothetical protein